MVLVKFLFRFGSVGLVVAPAALLAETLLLDFSSPGCGPCQQMRPVVAQLAATGQAVREIDITREPQLAGRFNVTLVPTFVVLVDGREAARTTGPTSFAHLQETIARVSTPPSRPAENPGTAPTISAPVISNPFGSAPQSLATETRLIEASVRLAVEDAQGTSSGTGTIVDARSGEALVLTCGHLFRTSNGQGPITVTMFQIGPSGVQLGSSFTGRLIDFDLERDLALVSFRPSFAVKPIRIAPSSASMAPGTSVISVGCSHGELPTVVHSQVTANDRYQGPSNVEVAGAPIEGRSGGGLFNAQQELVGVCFAADPQDNEGLYASLRSIHAKLDDLGLAMVYQQGGTASPPQAELADASVPGEFAVRGQEPSPPPSAAASLSTAERATLEEIQRRGLNSEVICIIRPQDPEGKSEVITLRNTSPAFVEALMRSRGGTVLAR